MSRPTSVSTRLPKVWAPEIIHSIVDFQSTGSGINPEENNKPAISNSN